MTNELTGADWVQSIDERLAEHSRIRRKYLGFSQATIAKIMKLKYGVEWHQTVLAKIENRERAVKLSEAFALARVYQIPLNDLIEGEGLDRPAKIRAGRVRVHSPQQQ